MICNVIYSRENNYYSARLFFNIILEAFLDEAKEKRNNRVGGGTDGHRGLSVRFTRSAKTNGSVTKLFNENING
ncbi:hypothetical protein EGLA_19540 [Enterococcus gallinarum]|nr:hypothetical protein AH4_12530 [Enterococcus gallinarum]